MSSGFKKGWNIFTGVLVALLVILAILLVGMRLFFRVYSVLSPSMEPAFKVGSLIYVKKTAPEDVRVGDPITFVMNEKLDIVTHRVVEIEESVDGKGGTVYRYTTKGDANDTNDGRPVRDENLLGVPVFSIPYLGYAADFIQHPPGVFVAVGGGALILFLVFLPDLLEKDRKKSAGSASADGAAVPREQAASGSGSPPEEMVPGAGEERKDEE